MSQAPQPPLDDETPEHKIEQSRKDEADLTAKIDALDEATRPKSAKVPDVGSMF